jgi:hypothetical protein
MIGSGRSNYLRLVDFLHERDLPFPVAPEPEQNDRSNLIASPNEFHVRDDAIRDGV